MKRVVLAWMFIGLIAWAGDGVGTGGGLVEPQFTLAYSKMELFLRETIARKDQLKLPLKDVTALLRLLNLQYQELPVSEALVFETDPKKFEWQTTCSELKVAYTWLHGVGKPIHLNVSVFYTKEGERLVPALSFSSVVQLLVHELGHHAGYEDHHWLDGLGQTVAGVASGLMGDELKQIANYLEKVSELGVGAPRFVELSDYRRLKRQRFSGTFYPYVQSLVPLSERAKAELFFLPNGARRLYRISLADKSLEGAFAKETTRATSGFAFPGSVEVVAVGKGLVAQGKLVLDTSAADADTYAVVNLWPSEVADTQAISAVFGQFGLDSAGRPFIEETHRGKYHRDYLKFVDARFEKVLVDYLKEFPRPRGVAFTTRPYEDSRPIDRPVETTTFIFSRR